MSGISAVRDTGRTEAISSRDMSVKERQGRKSS